MDIAKRHFTKYFLHSPWCFFWLGQLPLPGHQLHISMIKCVFHSCSKTKKKHLASHSVTSVLCKDPVGAGMEGKRLLGGDQPSPPLENFPRCCGHEVALSGCIACNTSMTSFYQFLVFGSKVVKWLRLFAPLSQGGVLSHQWCHTLAGQRRFGISALSHACNSILKIPGK